MVPNVGIGTTSPAQVLDVNGSTNLGKSYFETTAATVASGTAYTIPDLTRNIVRIQLTGNATITLPTAPTTANTVYNVTVWIQQDATGSRTLAFAAPAGESLAWDSSSLMPAVNATASKRTIYQFIKIQGDTTWYGSQVWKEN
jgi:hypothetical protein